MQSKQQNIAKLDATVAERVAQNPESFATNNTAAGYYLQEGNNKKAEALAEKAFTLAEAQGKPSLASRALVNRGLARFAEDHSTSGYQAAHADGCGAYKLDPKNRAALELCKYTEAKSSIDPQTAQSLAKTTQDLQEISRRLAALQDPGISHSLDEWSSRCAGNPAPICRLEIQANESLNKGDLAAALRQAEAALKLDSTDAFAYFQRGIARWKLKDANGAILDYTQAISRGWTDDNLYGNRAEALLATKSYSAALKDADMAVALNPGSAPAHYTRAKIKLGLRLAPEKVYADLYAAAHLDPAKYEEERQKFLKALPDPEKLASWTPAKDEVGGQASAAAPRQNEPASNKSAPLSGPLAIGLGAGGALLLALALFGLYSLLKRKGPETAAAESAGAPSPARPHREWVFDSASPDKAAGAPGTKRDGTIAAGTLLGGVYRVVRELGRGGMGVVYLAEDLPLQRQVAVKQVGREVRGKIDDVLKEARLVAKLKHPNIVEIYTVLEEAGEVYLIFENVDGDTLSDLLDASPRLPLDKAREILAKVGQAVDFAHGRKIFHRDLKPSNIMIAKDQTAKVMDFGIAHQSQGGKDFTQTAASGTPAYMPPEQAFGTVSAASDTYSLGVIAYEMLAGKRPYDGDGLREKQMSLDFAPITSGRPELPAGLDAFFARALDPNPAKRFPSAGELLKAFDAAAKLGGVHS